MPAHRRKAAEGIVCGKGLSMKDWLHGVLKWIDYERGKVFGVLLGIGIVLLLVGCDPTVPSPISGDDVTRIEFAAEVAEAAGALDRERLEIESLQAEYNRKVALLSEQQQTAETKFTEVEQFRQGFLELAAGVAVTAASGGTIAWPAVLSSLIALAGIGGTVGGVIDSARKNRIIAEAKTAAT